MPDRNEAIISGGVGRVLISAALLFYLSSAVYLHTGSEHLVFQHTHIPKYLVNGTLFLIGIGLHVIGLMTRPYYRRYTWIMIPMLGLMAFMLGRDWLQLLA